MRCPDRLPYRDKALLPRAVFGVTALLCSACFSAGEGLDPPRERIYFPVGLALTGDSRFLVVANSDYDLQFNAGTLQAFDVERMLALAPTVCGTDADCTHEGTGCDPGSHLCAPRGQNGDFGSPCGEVPERELSKRLLYPGRCDYIRPERPPSGESLLKSSVEIGAFATDVIYRQPPLDHGTADPGRPGRVFLPVRGDATLHWADIDEDGNIDCGQDLNGGACDDTHRAGDDPDLENSRDVRLPSEPFAIDADPSGRVIVVSHQTRQDVSLFRNDWGGGADGARIEYTLGGLGVRPVGVASLPPPITALPDYPPGFLVTFRAAPQVDLVRYYADGESGPARPFLARTGISRIQVNASGVDSRGIAVDAARRATAEQQCLDRVATTVPCVTGALRPDGEPVCEAPPSAEELSRVQACLQLATATPVDVYVANRAPSSLLIGRTQPAVNAVSSTELPTFYDSIPLPASPSRVAVGNVCVGGTAEQQNLVYERRVFVVSDDSSRITVYDPERRRIETEIATGPGPHAIAVDSEHRVLYVAHFLESYIGVVSLDRRFPRTYGVTLATVGEPLPPRASK